MNASTPATIDEYIAGFPPAIRQVLEQVRSTIRRAAPDAQETMKYAMPTFVLNGNLVHFAAFKKHIGLYPVPSGISAFEEELSAYKKGKGSVQFPLDGPMPLDLIARIVAFRVAENRAKAGVQAIFPVSAPARRALAGNGITTLEKLAEFSEADILALHGMGPGSLPGLRKVLAEKGLRFR